MKRATFDEMRALEDGHWWFRARRGAIAAHVDCALAASQAGAVLDVGCGTGANLIWLSQRAPSARLVGVEFDGHALELARGRPLRAPLVQADATHLPFAAASAACIVCCDVLEHIEDDASACREMARVLIPGGILVATVPACPSLWSLHDEAASHRRRYSGGELEERLREAGFSIEASHGFNLASWPLVWAIRRWRWHSSSESERAAPTSDFRTLPAPINSGLVGWLALESALLRSTGIRAGVSLVIRARRV